MCGDDYWQQICKRAIADAKNGDHRAREWLSKYLIGDPDSAAKVLHAHLHAEIEWEGEPSDWTVDQIIAAKVLLDEFEIRNFYGIKGNHSDSDINVS